MREWLIQNHRWLTDDGSAVLAVLVCLLMGVWAIRRRLRPRQWMPWAMLVVTVQMLFSAWVAETPLLDEMLRIAIEWVKAAVFVVFLEWGMNFDWRRPRGGSSA